MNYLIDTCIISDFFKKHPVVIEKFKQLSPQQIHISSITVMEIEYGLNLNAEREKKIRPLWEQLRKHTSIISFSYACAVSAASIRSQLKNQGLLIGPFDILIAGSAMANNMIMITANLKEFKRVSGIKIENWRTVPA